MKDEFQEEALASSFISANSRDGFYSMYDEVFDPRIFDRIFVIAGGPGTGKSSLLRRVHKAVDPRKVSSERILCSSDPHSLDGLILETHGRRVGILDGTPPHGRILRYPAIAEEIVDLGALWDTQKIQKSRDVIFSLAEKKKNAYARAYSLLSALGAIGDEEALRYRPVFDESKARRQIKHKLQKEKTDGEVKKRFLRAISGTGEVILPFTESAVSNLLLIGRKEAPAEIYLSLFEKIAKEEGVDHTVYLSPVSPQKTDAIYLPATKTLLIKERLSAPSGKGRRIVADRFFTLSDTEEKEVARAKQDLKTATLAALAEASAAHRAMEACYSEAMDFSGFDLFSEKVIKNVLRALSD